MALIVGKVHVARRKHSDLGTGLKGPNTPKPQPLNWPCEDSEALHGMVKLHFLGWREIVPTSTQDRSGM